MKISPERLILTAFVIAVVLFLALVYKHFILPMWLDKTAERILKETDEKEKITKP